MKFRAAHKAATYGLVAASVGTLAAGRAAPGLSLLLFVAAAAASWFAEPQTRFGGWVDRIRPVLTALAVAVFAATMFAIVRSFPEPDLTPILHLVLFLLDYKLFQRRKNRDHLQIYVLSFLLMLAAAWLSQSVTFAVGFVAYVVVSTWGLVLFHLRREIEDNYLVKHAADSHTLRVTVARVLDSKRVVNRSFFAVTAAAALAVVLGSTVVFVLAPRIGLGFLTGGMRRRANIVGFTDEVQLGQHGVLSSDNDLVVLRVRMPRLEGLTDDAREAAVSNLYWRGTIYDTYQESQWSRSRREGTETRLVRLPTKEGGRLALVVGPGAERLREHAQAVLATADRQDIEVVGLSHPVAFALDTPVAYEAGPVALGAFHTVEMEGRYSSETALRLMRVTPSGVMTPLPDFAGARYTAYSRDTHTWDRLSNTRRGELTPAALQAYLSVPSSLSPRVKALADELTQDVPLALQKVQAIVKWLDRTHTYTTDLKRDPRVADPLEDFLFHQGAGHCEYFASATVILLRMAGVPARYVNGFLGGEWNDLGKHVTVRDNRAHSWAEAYLGPRGWVRVDATPAAFRPSRMSRVRQLLDSLESQWSRWVMDFDSARQVAIARSLARGVGVRRRADGAPSFPKPDARVFLVVVILGGAAGLMYRWRRSHKPGRGGVPSSIEASPIARLYRKGLVRLEELGLVRGAAETPREFLGRVKQALPTGDATPGRLLTWEAVTRAYERARWQGQAPTEDDLARLEAAVNTWPRRERPAA